MNPPTSATGTAWEREQWIAVARTGNVVVHLPWAIAFSAWALAELGEASEALNRLQEGEQLLDRNAARGVLGNLGWVYHVLGRAALRLGRLDAARRPGDRAGESPPRPPRVAGPARPLPGG